ncbi:MAG: hypothetical protein SGJ11_17710 [Phycisphaerae bacterium]|nr:hypothetical protein [Phycisphaerae bacterium]
MELHPDFRELLASFNSHHVEYLVVGGYAVAFHGAPRFTGDIDLFVRATPDNAQRVVSALTAFGFGSLGLSAADFSVEHRVVQLGYEPWRVDLLTSLEGVSWAEAERGSVAADFGVPVRVIGRAELLRNKRALARPQDLADADRLANGDE